MKTWIPLTLLLFLFSCAGHHRVSKETGISGNACEIILKKQKLQYRLTLREARQREKRKVLVSAVKANTPVVEKVCSIYKNTKLSTLDACIGANASHPVIQLPPSDDHGVNSSYEPFVSKADPASISKDKLKSESSRLPSAVKGRKLALNNHMATEKFTQSAALCISLALAGFVSMLILRKFEQESQRLTHWAKENPWKTRGIIGLAQIATAAGSFWLGRSLYMGDVMIPEHARLGGMAILAAAASFYPNKYYANGAPAFSYLDRKFHDVGLFTAGAILTLYAGNHYYIAAHRIDQFNTVTSITMTGEKVASASLMSTKITLIKRQFKETIRTFPQDPKQKTKGKKIALTILVILGFVVLSLAVSALACNIACSGNEAAAIAVVIGGAALIAWGLTASLRGIRRSTGKEKKTKLETASSHPPG